jgi:hypothetical protein
MNHALRRPLYERIETERETKVIAFVTGERNGLQTQIAGDAVGPFVNILDRIGPVKRLSLIIDTNGGQTSAAWRLINLIKSFCDELEVVVPTKAMSAGTLIALGADKIIMTKQATLGPIDPSLDNHPLAPTITTASGQQLRIGISAEAVRGYIDEVKRDITDPVALAAVWTHLATQIHPIVLGEIFRLGGQIRALAANLIGGQVADKDVQDKIIQHLCSDSGSHDYTIDRRRAHEMGLKIEKPTHDLYGLLSTISQSYGDELQTVEPYSPMLMLGSKAQVDYKLVRGLIESTEQSYGYVSEGKFLGNSGTPGGVPVDQKIAEGWRKLP